MIVIVAVGLLVLVVIAVLVITGMSGASQTTKTVEEFQAYCNTLCSQMNVAADNIDTIKQLNNIGVAKEYQGSGCSKQFGCCNVVLRSGYSVCAEGECAVDADCKTICLPVTNYAEGQPIPGYESVYTFGLNPANIYIGGGTCYPSTRTCGTEGENKNKCVDHFLVFDSGNILTCTNLCDSMVFTNTYSKQYVYEDANKRLCTCG